MDASTSGRDAELSISMPVWEWQLIDGTADSHINTQYESPDWEVIRAIGMSVREAGWQQVAGKIPGVPGSGSWPPDDEIISVKLPRDHWSWVISVLEHWAQVSDRMNEQQNAAGNRALGDLIQSHLTA